MRYWRPHGAIKRNLWEGVVRGSLSGSGAGADHGGMLGREAGELRATTKATHCEKCFEINFFAPVSVES
jgi:hypothetical protein